jgi:methionyl-tRNA formyltransferase
VNIDVLCNDPEHPIIPWLVKWLEKMRVMGHCAKLLHSVEGLLGGDILLLVSCTEIISSDTRQMYNAALVVHASKLPTGRGWSPYIWEIIAGATEIHICLLEAEDRVDSGDVWFRKTFNLEGHELLHEVHEKLFDAEIELLNSAVENFERVDPEPQSDQGISYFTRRTPEDSELDPNLSIADQFNLLRVADPARFPSFFRYREHKYIIKIEKVSDESPDGGYDE